MLSKLIYLLSKEKNYLDSILANQLGVDEKMLRQLLYELARLGYVENVVPTLTSGQCNDCAAHCNYTRRPGNQSAVWMLTEKGRKTAIEIYKGE